jgi:tRNA U34 5-methylaminomethyl-2-thiouridine-forming methyltransferase MnmC
MQRELVLTADGSHTISIPEWNVTYHSKHGAVQESRHVFIEAGLKYLLQETSQIRYTQNNPIKILEIGYGSGLNALLSWQTANEFQCPITYTGIELYPLTTAEISAINYGDYLQMTDAFAQLNKSDWGMTIQLSDYFSIQKLKHSLLNFTTTEQFQIIFFDAFSPTVQPEMWSIEAFKKMFHLLFPGGILLTYCSKTVVRNAMKMAGFTVNKITGPYGKREMVRAVKEGKPGYP